MALVEVEGNPVPAGAVSGFFPGAAGQKLRFARWGARGPETLGTVCLFHGRTEFVEKYFEVIEELRERGFAVATHDWHGQGGSARALRSPLLGHCDSFEDYVEDVGHFMREVALPDCPPPYYALAHSMGGTILLHALTRRPSFFERAVLVAPMLRIALTRLSHDALRRTSGAACRMGLGRVPVALLRRSLKPAPFEGNLLTSDPGRYARLMALQEAAPHFTLGQPTFGWLSAACRAIDEIDDPDFPARLTTPVLLVAAADDGIVSTRAVERLARRLKNGGLVMVPGSRHEVLMERDICRAAFWGAFDAFVPGSPVFTEELEELATG